MSQDSMRSPMRFADVEFDPRARTLIVAGQLTQLDARSSGVFLALAERFGDRVDKETLLRAAWPGQIVHENSLAKAISKLRRAIGESGVEIVASYGVGYILREVDEPSRGRAPPVAPSLAEPPRASGRIALALPIALLLTTGVVAWSTGHRERMRETEPVTHDAPNAVATILWVDDHPANNRLEVELFKRHRIAVHLAESTEDALDLLAMNRYSLVVSDLGRGEDRLAGLRMTRAMKERGMTVPTIIYTMRPKDLAGQQAQRRLVAGAGAADLAVTPEEVRSKVLQRVAPPA